ncbi:DUF2235 domain-containing protein [Methylobacterium radiodurans]|uniref:DUF2235 domain-containing protein n=1 Tax=Methylobacterium radiodurans TaxID=2202828 RepID=A0A2U8W068_9HYPH|nr:DUF2235 domain-containing protein [Methylobacterium radiodurans]AWN38852.1 DUF2235 domain-containing protein [Methylobacterium radiodurans]
MKRLAIFLDGTWNTLGNNTNVWRLKSLCDPAAPDQHVYYGQGVGTRLLEKWRGGVGGHGLDDEILDAYAWLVQIYEPSDAIFIFGFSRGAYAARSLSGLIAKCGVLRPGAPLSLEQLYARYRRGNEKTIRTLLGAPANAPSSLEERWVAACCHAADIEFVGVFDTVGSMGSPVSSLSSRIARYRFLDTHLYRWNRRAFHALALDEHRRSFEPTFWTRTIENTTPAAGPTRSLDEVEQRWFVGAHANVGGGYPSDILAQAPLKWLMDKAALAGLRFRPGFETDASDATAPIADSYAQFMPAPLRMIARPFDRPVGSPPRVGSTKTTSRINETIDGSVFERWRANPAYRPQNLSEWSKRLGVDPASRAGSVRAADGALLAAQGPQIG